jgi:hypothetical protein
LRQKDDKGDNDKQKDRGDKHIPVVPEANAAWVLVPFWYDPVVFFGTVFGCEFG